MSIRPREAALAANSLRSPSLDVRLNGTPLPGVFAAEITSNNHFAADRFSVRAAFAPTDLASYVDTPDLLLDLRVTLDAAPSTSLLMGAVDRLDLDPIGGTVHFAGRDLSAQLIEARTHETFANQTSSEIATLLAGRHGLSASVQATTTPVGRYWELEHDSITLDQFSRSRSEWDLLVVLAGHEGFDVWVAGTTLYFQRVAQSTTPATTLRSITTLNGTPNVTSLRLERALTLARDIQVTVKSWNSRQQTAFSQTASATGGTNRSSKMLNYIYVVPNLTAADALNLAQRRLAEISSHERIVVAEMPGDLVLTPRQLLGVEGTGTGFDQTYVIDEVERRFDLHDGFTQRIRARTCTAS
jgi:phage protein D